MRAKPIRRPEQHRVPQRRFPGRQRLGMAGAIEQQIGTEIFGGVLGHGIDPVDYGLADAFAKRVSGIARGSIDSFWASHSAAIPSAISRFGPTRGRPDGVRTGLPSSMMAKPSDTSAKPLAYKSAYGRYARGAPDRFLRIERRLPGYFVK